jgi:hypothetical protein
MESELHKAGSRVLLAKLIFDHLVKLVAFYGSRRLITVFTTARQRLLS